MSNERVSNERALAFTGYAMSSLDRDAVVRLCRHAESTGFECAPTQIENLSLAEIEEFGAYFRKAGLAIDTLHLPFGEDVDIASFYETERNTAVAVIAGWIDRAAAVGAKAVIQHPAATPNGTGTEGVEPFVDKLCASLETLLPHAEKRGIRIAVENMLPGTDCSFGSQPEHLVAIAERLAHPSLGFCLDTGHATVTRGPEGIDAFFDAFDDRLICFHLSDTAGDRDMHIAPGRGNVDWSTVFRRASALDGEIAMCIEVPPFAWGPPYADDAWRALVSETRGLMR